MEIRYLDRTFFFLKRKKNGRERRKLLNCPKQKSDPPIDNEFGLEMLLGDWPSLVYLEM